MPKSSNDTTPPVHSFAGLPVCTRLEELAADIAIIGIHYVSPYPQLLTTTTTIADAETAPDAIRLRSSVFSDHWDHYDFDRNEIFMANGQVRLVDCGDVDHPTRSNAPPDSVRITTAVGTVINRGAVPIILGTDEGGFIPFVRAYDAYDNICVVHIDAHIDWRDERHGVKEGYSSGMRRASELPWVHSMAQVGLRGVGSARQQEVDDAQGFGSVFIRAREVHRLGIDACMDRLPTADHYLITIDADALDTAIAPGVLFPTPGGLTFDETADLVQAIAARGPIAGISLFELRPERDISGLTAATCAQLIVNFIGTLARSGRMGG